MWKEKSVQNFSTLRYQFLLLFQVKTVSHDSGQLMKILHTVNSLVYNQSLFLDVQPYVSLIEPSFLFNI